VKRSTEVEEDNQMEDKVNGETTDHEVHVTQAEVSHEFQEFEEPVALKRNILPEISENEDQKIETNGEVVNTTEEAAVKEPEAEDSVPIEDTSETFMKIEEKNVIERLSRVVDTELILEVSRIDDQEVQESEVSDSKGEVNEIDRVVENEVTESDDSVGRVDLKNDYSIYETQANEVKLHAFEDNSVKTDNHIEDNERTFESGPRVVSGQAFEPEVVKYNGTKLDENQNEDEEEDELKEIIGFKNKLKLWSSGKNNQSADQPIDSRNKFKTLRQIKKGNTRSLMEKFQPQK